jgi:carbamoyltransferase
MDYFTYCYANKMVGKKFEQLFGGPRREPESLVTEREMNIAASIQKVTEEIMLRIIRFANEKTGMQNLVLAGGVALNCVGNGRILREGPYKNCWIQPAAGDSGGALGAALFVYYQLLNCPRDVNEQNDFQCGSYLGPAYSSQEVHTYLDSKGANYHFFEEEHRLIEQIVRDIQDGKVIGWFQDRMEFGPRALGNRSIIGNACNEQMQSFINQKIKFRESFRPFAASVLLGDANEYFDLIENIESPYMLLVAPVQQAKRIPLADGQEKVLISKRSEIPAVTHVDYSTRIQTIDAKRHGRYYRLLQKFKQKSGVPLLLNTSFNIRGEPIVCSPEDAFRCFKSTGMDVLVLGDFVLYKSEQPEVDRAMINEYMAQIESD